MICCPHCGGDIALTAEEVALLRRFVWWDAYTPIQRARGNFRTNRRDFVDHHEEWPMAESLLKRGYIEAIPNTYHDNCRLTAKGFVALGVPAPKQTRGRA